MERHVAVVLAGDTGECGACLTLAAGAEIENVLGGNRTGVRLVHEFHVTRQDTNSFRGVRDAVHAAPDEADAAACQLSGLDDGFHARDI